MDDSQTKKQEGKHITTVNVTGQPKNIDPKKINAGELATKSTYEAPSEDRKVGTPKLVEKAQQSQQHGGTKHKNVLLGVQPASEKQDLDAIRKILQESLKGGETSIGQLHLKVEELIESKKKDTDMIEELQKKVDELSKQLIEERENQSKEQPAQIQAELSARNTEISELKKETIDLRQEIERLRTSLSKAAGAKLTDGNLDITDLSDENRPQKLCEKFNKLYDDCWTNAYEYLQQKDVERVVCQKLIEIFKNCWEFCLKCANQQLQDLEEILIHPNIPGRNEKDQRDKGLKHTFQSVELKLIKDIRKSLAKNSLEHLTQFYWKNKANQPAKLESYVNGCMEICWFSALNDPKVHFNFDPKTNKDDFRGYTKTGKYIDFVVWPAMYLHENGPLLYKGVVQHQEAEREQM